MKTLVMFILLLGFINLEADELRIVPAEPPLDEINKQADSAVIVLLCKPNGDGTKLEVAAVLKGYGNYEANKDRIVDILPASDREALATDGYRELVFIVPDDGLNAFRFTSSYALWPQRDESLGNQRIRLLAHDLKDLVQAIQGANQKNVGGVPAELE